MAKKPRKLGSKQARASTTRAYTRKKLTRAKTRQIRLHQLERLKRVGLYSGDTTRVTTAGKAALSKYELYLSGRARVLTASSVADAKQIASGSALLARNGKKLLVPIVSGKHDKIRLNKKTNRLVLHRDIGGLKTVTTIQSRATLILNPDDTLTITPEPLKKDEMYTIQRLVGKHPIEETMYTREAVISYMERYYWQGWHDVADYVRITKVTRRPLSSVI